MTADSTIPGSHGITSFRELCHRSREIENMLYIVSCSVVMRISPIGLSRLVLGLKSIEGFVLIMQVSDESNVDIPSLNTMK